MHLGEEKQEGLEIHRDAAVGDYQTEAKQLIGNNHQCTNYNGANHVTNNKPRALFAMKSGRGGGT